MIKDFSFLHMSYHNVYVSFVCLVVKLFFVAVSEGGMQAVEDLETNGEFLSRFVSL